MNLLHSFIRKPHFSAGLLVFLGALFAIIAYLQALHYPFIFDDVDYISTNTRLAQLPWTQLWRLFVEPYNDMAEFLPLRELSYWLDMKLFGMAPEAFRIHNMVLYVLCLPLVYLITLQVWGYFRPDDASSAPWVAALVSALFALHPSHAEAVVWIAARKDLLSTLFSLLAIWLSIKARGEHGLSSRYAVAALLALLAAMMSKATAVAVAPVMALIWLAFWRDIPPADRRRTMLLWPLAGLLLAAILAVTFATIITSKVPMYFGVEAVTRTLAVLGWLTRLSVSPEGRHFFYPVFEDPYLPAMVLMGVAVLVAAMAALVLRKRTLEGFAVLVFLLICLPSIQIIPYAAPSLVSDRFISLAVWPATLLLVAGVWRLRLPLRVALLSFIAVTWGYQTVERPRDWQSFEVFVEAELRASPGLYIPAMYKIFSFQLNLMTYDEALQTARTIAVPEFRDGMIAMIEAVYVLRKETAKNGDPEQAMRRLWNIGVTLTRPPDQAKWNPPVNNYWTMCKDLLGMEWQYLTGQFPNDASVRYHAGLWMLDANNFALAVDHLRAATASPHLLAAWRGQAYKSLGMALIGAGDAANAEAPLREALNYSPADKQVYCLLSWVYQKNGRIEESVRAQASCR